MLHGHSRQQYVLRIQIRIRIHIFDFCSQVCYQTFIFFSLRIRTFFFTLGFRSKFFLKLVESGFKVINYLVWIFFLYDNVHFGKKTFKTIRQFLLLSSKIQIRICLKVRIRVHIFDKWNPFLKPLNINIVQFSRKVVSTYLKSKIIYQQKMFKRHQTNQTLKIYQMDH